ncbi:alpha/beta fold hydrolase [Pseudonocardia sp.]|jgi:acylglycerol lipase|uniref:alpha/beta hydrolase n=1 Tax=Pseudonocardia sp. TaxID=60912 RepID=UPI0026118567|nr:alpha/beta fold hydrolase [Pseudonocardia sp.]MCW2717183.1 hypothetical protein [Pseudonocardia sp.]MDT7614122.1 acylglycerol lipase [Pseudonocardiales bacterium]
MSTAATGTTVTATTAATVTASFGGRSGTVRYHRWRPSGAPVAAVLLLHGLGEHGGRYADLAEAATAAGIEVWAPDQAGHGRSDGERGLVADVADLVADAETMLRALRGARPRLPVVVAGHALGAAVATLLVGEVRDGSDAGGPPDDPAADVVGLVLADSSLTSAAGVQALPDAGGDPLGWTGPLRPETVRALGGAAARTSRLVSVGALDHLPVLLLHAQDDAVAPVATAQAVAAVLPRGRVCTVPHGGHDVLDQAEACAELVRFVTAVAAVSAARS